MALQTVAAKGAAATDPLPSRGIAGTVRGWSRTVEMAAAANANSTFDMGYIPSNAKIMSLSRLAFDDMASAGAPTLDIGLAAVDGNITTKLDALNDGLDCATAASSASLLKDIANAGKAAWEFIPGLTADPGGTFIVRVSLQDAAANTGGTLTMEMLYLEP